MKKNLFWRETAALALVCMRGFWPTGPPLQMPWMCVLHGRTNTEFKPRTAPAHRRIPIRFLRRHSAARQEPRTRMTTVYVRPPVPLLDSTATTAAAMIHQGLRFAYATPV